MSGTIHILDKKNPLKFTNTSFYHSPFLPKKHNHVEFVFDNLKVIYNDPRRFGFFEIIKNHQDLEKRFKSMGPCLLYTSPSPRDQRGSRMPSSA